MGRAVLDSINALNPPPSAWERVCQLRGTFRDWFNSATPLERRLIADINARWESHVKLSLLSGAPAIDAPDRGVERE